MTTTILITTFGHKEEWFSYYPKATDHFHFSTGMAEIENCLDTRALLISTFWSSLPKVNTSYFLLHLEKNKYRGGGRKRDYWKSKIKIQECEITWNSAKKIMFQED